MWIINHDTHHISIFEGQLDKSPSHRPHSSPRLGSKPVPLLRHPHECRWSMLPCNMHQILSMPSRTLLYIQPYQPKYCNRLWPLKSLRINERLICTISNMTDYHLWSAKNIDTLPSIDEQHYSKEFLINWCKHRRQFSPIRENTHSSRLSCSKSGISHRHPLDHTTLHHNYSKKIWD